MFPDTCQPRDKKFKFFRSDFDEYDIKRDRWLFVISVHPNYRIAGPGCIKQAGSGDSLCQCNVIGWVTDFYILLFCTFFHMIAVIYFLISVYNRYRQLLTCTTLKTNTYINLIRIFI